LTPEDDPLLKDVHASLPWIIWSLRRGQRKRETLAVLADRIERIEEEPWSTLLDKLTHRRSTINRRF
jgi:hypothetical protein